MIQHKLPPMRGHISIRNEYMGASGRLEREDVRVASEEISQIDITPLGFTDRTNSIQLSRVVIRTHDGEFYVFNASWMA